MPAVVWSAKARNDIAEIWLWIAEHSGAATADTIGARIERRAAALASHPHMGRLRPEIAEGARSLVCERWLVLYIAEADLVKIARVLDGARDLHNLD